ncbi:MAG: hypothetical protein WBE92_11175 [Steroidobacteraceae bacterium]
MTEMTNSAVTSLTRSNFDAFLLASIGDDSSDNGMPLSVLSALARQNVDPWEEAASLACLPSQTAIQKLTSLIARLPEGRSTRPDPGANAARLIALLPHGAGRDIRSRTTIPGRKAAQRWPVRQVVLCAISVAIILALQWFATSHLATELRREASTPAASTASSSPPRMPNTGE